MIRKTFDTRLKVDIYLQEQKFRMEKGYLSKSERNELIELLKKPDNLVVTKQPDIYKGRKIVTDISKLRQPCELVGKDEDVSTIIKELKEAHEHYGGMGISANQIGYNRKISYIKFPVRMDEKTKKVEWSEFMLINPIVIEKDKPVKFVGEGCLSFPGVFVDTLRYCYCTVQYEDEQRKGQVNSVQDMESFVIMHEVQHLNGKTIFDNKWRASN